MNSPKTQKNSICWWKWLHTSVGSQWNYHKWLHQFENYGKRICTSYATTPSRSPWRNKNRTVQGTDNHLLWHKPQYNNNSPMWCQYTNCGGMNKTDQPKVCWKNSRNGVKVTHPNRVKILQNRNRVSGSHLWPTKYWMFPTLVKGNSRNRPFTTLTNLQEKSSCDSIQTSSLYPKVPKICHPSQVPVREDNSSYRCLVKSAAMKIEKVHHNSTVSIS